MALAPWEGVPEPSLTPSPGPMAPEPGMIPELPPYQCDPETGLCTPLPGYEWSPDTPSSLFEWLLLKSSEFIIESIVRPAIEGAIWLIDFIRAELRYWTYEAMKFLAELTSTTEGMIVTLALTIVAAVTIPQLIAKFMTTSVGLFITKMVEWVGEKAGNILEAIHFVDLIAVHQVLLAIWPQWRELFTQFSDAISALAEQLGQGSGYIHAWLSVAHGLSMVGTSLLGIDPKVGEIRAMETSQNFMKRLDERFRTYSHDPGEIVVDIINDVYIPYAEEIRDTHTGTIEAIKDTRDYTLTLDQNLNKLDDAIQNLIEATIPELRGKMAENFSGLREVISFYTDWLEGTVLPGIDLSINVLEERADRLERSNEVARRKLNNPIEIFMATEFQDQSTQLATWNYIKDQILSLTADAEGQATELIRSFTEEVIEGLDKTPFPEIEIPSLAFEVPGIPAPAYKPSDRKRDWFVGEW